MQVEGVVLEADAAGGEQPAAELDQSEAHQTDRGRIAVEAALVA